MRIRGTQPGTPVTPSRPSASERAKEGGASGAKAELVELSSLARMLTDVRAPEVLDVARIEALQARIADGSFDIDAKAIADRMLAEESG